MTTSETVVHPGKRLADELAELGISASELAEAIRVPTNRVTQIVKGQRAVTADTALRLGHFFGTSAMTWLNLQSRWDLVQAHKAAGREVTNLPTMRAWRERNQD
jgi:addiction module HigA family antidote